mmetsp:Transcript_13845/g.31746  ORF Transcript_13845/g.31746 Transcript_13845/m.31746 type:complete len:208 (+) Transcript_13845:1390-2013(+)
MSTTTTVWHLLLSGRGQSVLRMESPPAPRLSRQIRRPRMQLPAMRMQDSFESEKRTPQRMARRIAPRTCREVALVKPHRQIGKRHLLRCTQRWMCPIPRRGASQTASPLPHPRVRRHPWRTRELKVVLLPHLWQVCRSTRQQHVPPLLGEVARAAPRIVGTRMPTLARAFRLDRAHPRRARSRASRSWMHQRVVRPRRRRRGRALVR